MIGHFSRGCFPAALLVPTVPRTAMHPVDWRGVLYRVVEPTTILQAMSARVVQLGPFFQARGTWSSPNGPLRPTETQGQVPGRCCSLLGS